MTVISDIESDAELATTNSCVDIVSSYFQYVCFFTAVVPSAVNYESWLQRALPKLEMYF